MFAVDTAMAAKGLALSAASAAKSLIQWLPSAIAASISSYGIAAAVGAAAVTAILVARNNFAEGGLVTGPGTGTSDSIPAWLSNGEYVMPAATVERLGVAEMRRIHHGTGYASGGLVTSGESSTRKATSSVREAPRNTYVVFGEDELRRRILRSGDFDAEVIRVNRETRR
jgi:hypothetical protein